jgi:dTMP kinase
MLLNPEIEIDPVTELLLFSSARSQLIAEKVKPLLADGVVVILDRFYDSTTAYQGYGRKSIPIDQVHQINKIASHEIAPDVTFYLRLSLEESANRTAHMQKDRMEQSGIEFFQNVIKGFDELSKSEDRFVTIDSNKKCLLTLSGLRIQLLFKIPSAGVPTDGWVDFKIYLSPLIRVI